MGDYSFSELLKELEKYEDQDDSWLFNYYLKIESDTRWELLREDRGEPILGSEKKIPRVLLRGNYLRTEED
jgi:hypothetical protein